MMGKFFAVGIDWNSSEHRMAAASLIIGCQNVRKFENVDMQRQNMRGNAFAFFTLQLRCERLFWILSCLSDP
jgi:hypothetical protein